MHQISGVGQCLTVAFAAAAALTSAACCPTTAGPTAPAASYSATLAPGEFRFYDADTPSSTTQINLDFMLDSLTVPLRLRQIDPNCVPAPGDTCQTFSDTTMQPRPAGVLRFGNSLQPHGTGTRIVLQNMSPSETVTYTITITSHRAGCYVVMAFRLKAEATTESAFRLKAEATRESAEATKCVGGSHQ